MTLIFIVFIPDMIIPVDIYFDCKCDNSNKDPLDLVVINGIIIIVSAVMIFIMLWPVLAYKFFKDEYGDYLEVRWLM